MPPYLRVLNDTRDLRLGETRLTVRTAREGNGCRAHAYFAAAEGEVQVDSLYSESRYSFLPPFRKLEAVTVNGHRPPGGDVVHLRLRAR